MFEIAREKMHKNRNDSQVIETEIIYLLKKYEYSLSETRELFHAIVNKLEDTPLK